ncbi:hypothetical protein NL676_030646 [Syzygium grande]|nr:hypothetical protein NL676_030646 [Syzygium grande]
MRSTEGHVGCWLGIVDRGLAATTGAGTVAAAVTSKAAAISVKYFGEAGAASSTRLASRTGDASRTKLIDGSLTVQVQATALRLVANIAAGWSSSLGASQSAGRVATRRLCWFSVVEQQAVTEVPRS